MSVVVLVHGLEPAHVVVGVGHEVDVDQAGDSGRTRGVAARAETRGRGLDISITSQQSIKISLIMSVCMSVSPTRFDPGSVSSSTSM